MSEILTKPRATKTMPNGIPYIVGNEAAERFSYYGMKAILVVYMTKYLLDGGGGYDVMSAEDAKYWYHLFGMAVYFFPVLGAIIADAFLGKYRTIMTLSVVYCLGHGALAIGDTSFGTAIMEPRMWLAVGLTLIAMGSGGIKPCVSAHVGDQFGKSNQHLLEKVFGWFYFAINLGAFASTLLTPVLLDTWGPAVAFGVPGILMFLATVVFWMGRKVFVHIPEQGMGFVKETFSGDGLKATGKLMVLYAFVAMFWALFDQTGSAWVLQAENMDRNWLGIEWLPSQIQAINPIMILFYIPLFSFVIYPALNKVFPLTPLRKIGIGLFLTVPAFMLPALVESWIVAGETPNIGWQVASYAIITAAEVFVSITCLEFSYTQAPKKMKSLVMGLFLMSVSIGNLFTAVVNAVIQDEVAIEGATATSGTITVKPEKTTTYAMVCKGDLDSAGDSVEVAYISPELAANRAKKAAAAGEEKVDPNMPIIESFTVNGLKGRVTVDEGSESTLAWSATNAEKCAIRPDGSEVELKGSKAIKPEKTTTYVIACTKGDNEAEARLTVAVTKDARITSLTASANEFTEIREIVLTWESEKANECTLTAQSLTLAGPYYYLFFAAAMLLTAIVYVFYAMGYKYKTYIQEEEGEEGEEGEDADTADSKS